MGTSWRKKLQHTKKKKEEKETLSDNYSASRGAVRLLAYS
jgi:hypothetical protein